MDTDSNRKRQRYLTWDQYFMAVALVSAERSKDPVTQVGACIVNADNRIVGACIVNADNRIVGIGYNGMPNGCSDDDMPWGKNSKDILNTKKLYVCHAEMNAIVNKICADIRGCKMYVTLYPCNNCAKIIIQSGIKHVVYFDDKNRHKDEAKASQYMFDKAGITIRKYNSTSTQLNIGTLKSRL
ncbi:comEB [Mytilus coruscus]|uniref:dCMP deaminase n=1 Tax=Mytilus coruscus TaxID=42192 RepID=A0A6J8AGR4_MYTCO|nr:comEB [Mytilus coruscus]